MGVISQGLDGRRVIKLSENAVNKAGFVKNALLPSSCLQLSVMTNLDYLLPDRETYYIPVFIFSS